MKRFLSVSLALAVLSGCSGGLGGRLAPDAPGFSPDRARGHAKASVTLTVPRRHRKGIGPRTISPSTQSISVVVNATPPQTFNLTTSSKNCFTSDRGLTCTLVVVVPYGKDTFLVTTYSAQNAGGFALDQGRMTMTVTTSTPSIAITLGPVFSNALDSGPGSLRQAVADANAGDTILYVGTTPATVTLGSPLVLNKNVAIAGPGETSLTLSGNDASRLFDVALGVTASLSGMTLTKGHAPQGGAILNQGTLAIDSVAFVANHAFAQTAPVRQPRPPAIAHARVRWGMLHGHRHRLLPPHPPRPQQHRLPHYYVNGEGGAIYDGLSGTMALKSPLRKRPEFPVSPTPSPSPPPAGFLTITNSSFTGNSVPEGYEGGAIFNGASFALNVSDTTFTSNSGAYGGAVETDGPAVFSNDTFNANTGFPGDVNAAYGYGGAIHSDGTTTISGCTFHANVAGGTVASSYGYGGAVDIDNGTATITGSTFTFNTAGGLKTNGDSGYGGAIENDSGHPLEVDNSTFTSNSAGGTAGYGGAIGGGSPITGTGDTFNKNLAFGDSSYGGAIDNDGVTLTQSSFTSNKASTTGSGSSSGGALYSDQAVVLTNVTFSSNLAVGNANGTAYGGAALFTGSSNVLTGVTFSNNSATGSYAEAGALDNDGPTAISNGTFESNVATNVGGALYNDDVITIAGTTLSGNSVTAMNSYGDGGGAVYNDDQMTVTSSTVSANAVTSASGSPPPGAGAGGIYNDDQATIANSTIVGNTSSLEGGGIFNNDSTVLLVNATVYQNQAQANGGNIANGYGGEVSLQNSILASGTAPIGANMDVGEGSLNSLDYNVIFGTLSGNAISGMYLHNLSSDPKLLALANNGGLTQTNADQQSSPGYNYIPLANCTGAKPSITTDQRGLSRGDNGDGLCDVGAFELQVGP